MSRRCWPHRFLKRCRRALPSRCGAGKCHDEMSDRTWSDRPWVRYPPRWPGLSSSEVRMSLILHFHPLSSFCWKALTALYENDTPFTPNMVNLGDPGERAALLKLWPICRFPVLEDKARGEVVPESSIIIEYLDRHYPGRTRFIPEEAD